MVKSLLVAEVDAIILGGRFGLFCHQFLVSRTSPLRHHYVTNMILVISLQSRFDSGQGSQFKTKRLVKNMTHNRN